MQQPPGLQTDLMQCSRTTRQYVLSLSADLARLREALLEAAEMTEHETDRTLIYNHCKQSAEEN